MDMPMQVNGSRDPFPIPFRKFFNLWPGHCNWLPTATNNTHRAGPHAWGDSEVRTEEQVLQCKGQRLKVKV